MAAIQPPHIGTLREKPLHASLKQWLAEPADQLEVAVDGYVIDVVRGEVLIEIQTRGFSSMKAKVQALLDAGHPLRIVHPVAVDRWIVKLGEGGEILSRRRSPRHGGVTDVFAELVAFPGLVRHAGLEIDVVLTEQEELRTHTPGRSWRRKGWSVIERRLVEVLGVERIGGPEDLTALLPPHLPEAFTTAELADALGRPRRLAQQMAYCLREAGATSIVDKRGNALVYSVAAG